MTLNSHSRSDIAINNKFCTRWQWNAWWRIAQCSRPHLTTEATVAACQLSNLISATNS